MRLHQVIRIFAALGLVMAATAQSQAGPAMADEGVVASATGSGHFTSGGELRTFAVAAVKRADGSVSGEYQVRSRAGAGAVFHVGVTCMSVVGNQAWVAGIIEQSDDPRSEERRVGKEW